MACTKMLLCRHRVVRIGMCPHGSPNLHSVSLFLLAVTFPSSVCMFLGMHLHLWEEGSQGWEKQLLQNPGSTPNRPTGQRGPRGHHLWLLLAPRRAQSGATNLTHTPPTPRRSLGWGTHIPKGTGLFCIGYWPLVRVGTPWACCGWERAAGIHTACWEC